MDLAVASSLMKSARGSALSKHVANYRALNCGLQALEHDSDEFKMVCCTGTAAVWKVAAWNCTSLVVLMWLCPCCYTQVDTYVQNTHAKTHSSYTLEVLDVFLADRAGEAKKYAAWKDMHNRRLLWHGSRLTNWVGILSQGLRIAPPEAPVTGYMFGKGVYFAVRCSACVVVVVPVGGFIHQLHAPGHVLQVCELLSVACGDGACAATH